MNEYPRTIVAVVRICRFVIDTPAPKSYFGSETINTWNGRCWAGMKCARELKFRACVKCREFGIKNR